MSASVMNCIDIARGPKNVEAKAGQPIRLDNWFTGIAIFGLLYQTPNTVDGVPGRSRKYAADSNGGIAEESKQ